MKSAIEEAREWLSRPVLDAPDLAALLESREREAVDQALHGIETVLQDYPDLNGHFGIMQEVQRIESEAKIEMLQEWTWKKINHGFQPCGCNACQMWHAEITRLKESSNG